MADRLCWSVRSSPLSDAAKRKGFARLSRGIPCAAIAVCAFVACCLVAIGPAQAAGNLDSRLERLQTDDLEDLFGFVAGNVLFALYHEGGHMLVSELDLPVQKF